MQALTFVEFQLKVHFCVPSAQTMSLQDIRSFSGVFVTSFDLLPFLHAFLPATARSARRVLAIIVLFVC